MHMLHYLFVEIIMVCLQLSTIEVYMSNPIVSLFPGTKGVHSRQSSRFGHRDSVLKYDLVRRKDNESMDYVGILHLQTSGSYFSARTMLLPNCAPKITCV